MRVITLTFALSAGLAVPAHAETVVSLTFDDGQASQVQVKDMLASRGMRGTFFVNSAKVGTSGFYMTWSQVDALAAGGNEIGGHTLTHVDLMDTSVSDTEKRRQVCEDRQNLIARGYDPVDFAYPSGWGDALAESIVSDCGYRTARRVGGIVSPGGCSTCGEPHAESLPPEDPFLVRTPSFGSGEITLAAMQNAVTQAELAGGWVPLVFHGVCDSACGEGWVRPSTLAALMDWLAARAGQGTVVRTMREALDPGTPSPTPPDTSITSGPSGTVASSAASFAFSSTKAGSSFECKLDAGAWEACSSPRAYSGLADGAHTFSVRATDATGSLDASPSTRTWTIDTAAPDTSVTSGPSGTVKSTSASFGFSASATGSTFECRLDAGAWGACTSPKAYSGLANGAHTFSVRAKDGVGNVDASPATRTWTADTVAPNTSITSGPSGTVSSTTATFAFTATEAGSTFECRLDGGAWGACTSPKSYTGITAGSHTFSVRAKDAAGNVDSSPASRSWKRSRTTARAATRVSRARSCVRRPRSSRSRSSSKGSHRSARRARSRCRGS